MKAPTATELQVARIIAARGGPGVDLAAMRAKRDQARREQAERLRQQTMERRAKRAADKAEHQRRKALDAVEVAMRKRQNLERIARSAPGASTAHRGTKSTWNTADPTTVRREPDEPTERLTDGKHHPVTTRKADRG